MVQESFPTYRLRADDLEAYLREQFPDHPGYRYKVNVRQAPFLPPFYDGLATYLGTDND